MARGQTIVIKRIKKGHGGHHGGAWKVAYADFVTAMMAFFLLLWLLNAVSQEQLEGISDYFSPISTAKSTTGGSGMLQGRAVDTKGIHNAQDKRIARLDDDAKDEDATAEPAKPAAPTAPVDARLEEAMREREDQQFREAEAHLRRAIEGSPDLLPLANSLLIDTTPDGLRIQIIDQEGMPMFPRGSAEMYAHTRRILDQIAQVIRGMPQSLAISGHTDATRYAAGSAYGNWELSADRANAARRVLTQLGVPEPRIASVVGKAATEALLPQDPEAPGNRRLSLLLLRGSGAKGV